jgi:hypothetical protein
MAVGFQGGEAINSWLKKAGMIAAACTGNESFLLMRMGGYRQISNRGSMRLYIFDGEQVIIHRHRYPPPFH